MGKFIKIKQIYAFFLSKSQIEFNAFRKKEKIIDRKVTKRDCKLKQKHLYLRILLNKGGN